MQVKFLDLSLGFKRIESELFCTLSEIGESASFVGGRYVEEFERGFAHYIGTKGCVGVGNGTDALEIALLSLNLPKGSEVILPANTFFASLESVLNAGYRARIVDCDEDYLLKLRALEQSLEVDSENIGAIMPVHLYGQMCDMQSIMNLAQKYHIPVIEDASQAHGARMELGCEIKKAGSIGDIGCFSFYPGKNLGAFGDGGGIVSHNENFLAKARSLANHGIITERYKHEAIGRNSRLDSIQAVVLSLKLQNLDSANYRRMQIAGLYDEYLSGIDGLSCPIKSIQSDFFHIYHIYVLRLEGRLSGRRDELRAYLAQKGIESGVHYPFSLVDLPVVQNHPNIRIQSAQNAREYAKNIMSLPMGEHLSDEQVAYVCENLKRFCSGI